MIPASPATDQRPLRRALIALCATETISWGILYYAFPVAVATISADTGWSTSWATAAFSTGLVVSAIIGIPVGRWLQHCGPRLVMTGGSVLAVLATVLIAVAPTLLLFFAAWVVAGVAMSCVLYQPAFAAVTGWYGPRRVRAITAVTLVAGLASTIFAPLTDLLLQHFTWRTSYLILAAVLAVTTIPAHAFLLTPAWQPDRRHRSEPRGARERAPTTVRSIVRSREFLLLSGALTVTAFGLYAASLTLIPLLTGRGLSASLAAVALGLLGAGQLLGRMLYGPLAKRTSARARTISILGGSVLAVALLAIIPGPAAVLIALAILVGAVRGASTLLQATVVADHWGTTRYAALSGWFSAPITFATALAPWAGTAVAGTVDSYPIAFGIFAVLIAGAATAIVALGRNVESTTRQV